MDWLQVAKKSPSHGCQDFGPRFGRWGKVACPSLNDIIGDVESGTKEATGGKSGTKPIVSSKFAIKVIDSIEHKMLHSLLSSMKGSRLPEIGCKMAKIWSNYSDLTRCTPNEMVV
eukprot:symbB.v1.2.000797.t1/scaffold44.1/size390916/10